MGLDYGEILCTAVDEIVSTRLQGLSYDITKLCTIVDDTYSYQGKYKVSDGTAKYDAFSTDNNLKKGNSVLVTIPNGDYTMQKTIKGRVAATDTTPFKYTSPLDTMISISGDILNTVQPDGLTAERGLTANNEYRSIIGPIYSITDTAGLSGFSRLGISASFKSLLNGLDVVKGTYGIKVLIQSEALNKPGDSQSVIYDLDFSSADMIGNPYQFEDYFSQEKVFDISYIGKINRLDVYFYQNNDFIDGTGTKISTDYGDSGTGFVVNNLFVGDVGVYLGYDINEFKGETLLVYTSNQLSYSYRYKNNQKDIELRWIHLNDDGKTFTLINNNNIDKEKYLIHWFRYTPGYKDENLNKYAGKDWEEIEPNISPFECSFLPDTKRQNEQIKVIGIIKDGVSVEGKETETPYFSNILIFENEEYVPDSKTQEATAALSIYCEDGSEGNYFIYNQNGKINNQGIGQGYQRKLKALFKGAEITSTLGTLDWIRWYFPYDKTQNRSMLIMDGYFEDAESIPKRYTYKGTNYYIIERKPQAESTGDGLIRFVSDEQSYSIANQWNYKNSNNTIICRVSIDGVEYEAIEEMRFGKAGSNGTNTTFLLEFDDNKNALEAIAGSKISITAWLYSEEGQKNGFTNDMANQVSWSWYKKTPDKDYMTLDGSGITITITSNISYVPSDNYYILQATYEGLTAYLPIPIKASNMGYMEGAREVIYDHQGIPSYYNDAYRLYSYSNDKYQEEKDLTWELNCVNSGDINYMPKLRNQGGNVALSAALFYTSGSNEQVCVSVRKDGAYLWAQPILIMQSRYDFAMLNQWDGSLKLDEDNSTILAAMLGAGRKNSDNTFSGVLIGDIKKGSDLESANTLTGVYGFQNGKVSYSLTEDGRATLGANDNGQIIIDSSESSIKTKGYDTTGSSGMKIDLNSGELDIRNNDHESLIHLSAGLSNDPYFLIRTQDKKDLIKVDDNNYYLQSYNYSEASGSKYDLMSGEISVAGPGGSFRVSPQPNNPLLKIEYIGTDDGKDKKSTLLKVGGDEYYLQSKDYESAEPIKVYNTNGTIAGDLYKISNLVVKNGYGEYQEDSVDSNGNKKEVSKLATIINNNIYEVSFNERYYIGNVINFQSVVSNSIIIFTPEENKYRFLGKAVKQYGSAQLQYKGFKLDLNNNLITGYNLYLSGTKSDDNDKQIIIDSGAPTYPLRIGKYFAVDWDGRVTCTNPIIEGKNSNIKLGDYYFNSGGAGGGTWGGGCSGYAGGVTGFSPKELSDLNSTILYKS